MKKIETLYKGYEFYNREDNRCTILSKHFDSYECEEEEVISPDGLAETVNKRTVYYTAPEMRTMLHCSALQWEDRNRWYAVMKHRGDTDWGYGSYDLDEAVEMASVFPEGYIAVIDETGDPVCVDEIEIMRRYKITYRLRPDAENVEIFVQAKSYEDACVYAKEYRKESFSCEEVEML